MALHIANTARKFIFCTSKGEELPLTDLPDHTPEEILGIYAGSYPELTTATLSGPVLNEDVYEYRFETKLGTKG